MTELEKTIELLKEMDDEQLQAIQTVGPVSRFLRIEFFRTGSHSSAVLQF